jgi:ABC-type sugar transport system ATPase subunit
LSAPVLVQAESLTKHYDDKCVLDGVHLDIREGEVLALVGENGAGKSTLVGILTGVITPDGGRLSIDGRDVAIRSPADARRLGIAAVYQDFDLAPNLSVAENLVLAAEPVWRFGLINHAWQRQIVRTTLAAAGVAVDPRTLVGHLSVAERQLIAIAKATLSPLRLLVLDEPTSSLASDDVVRLLNIVLQQRAAGTAVLFISHKLDEVFRISDRISVFRDGRNVYTSDTAGTSTTEVVSMMAGRGSLPKRDRRRSKKPAHGKLLEVRGLRARGLRGPVDFSLGRGEVVGVYGLKGSGRIALLRVLFGMVPPRSGEIRLSGQAVRIRSPANAIRRGIGWVCRDRKALGLFTNLNVRENLTIAALDACSRAGFVDRSIERRATLDAMQQLAIKAGGPDAPLLTLSGGNQQKVLIARWLLCRPKLLILDEPTVGIDVGARAEIHTLIEELACDGIGILLSTSELPEVLSLADRVLVMHDGSVAGVLRRGEATEDRVMAMIHARVLPSVTTAKAAP